MDGQRHASAALPPGKTRYPILHETPVLYTYICLIQDVPNRETTPIGPSVSREFRVGVANIVPSPTRQSTVNVQIQGQQRASTVVRKYIHVLAVAVFIPGLIRECRFLYLASGVVLAVITVLELLHVIHMPPLVDVLQAGFTVFADDKDAGSLAFTPIYLLAACSLQGVEYWYNLSHACSELTTR